MNRRRIQRRIVLGLALVVLLSSCVSNGTTDGEVTVVATTTILGDIVRNVVGDEATVEVLIGLGVDPHEFAPSSQQAASLATASLVVATGLGLEAGLSEVIDSANQSGTPVLEVGLRVDPIPFGGQEGDGCVPDGSDPTRPCDPHFWMDPVRAGNAATAIAEALTDLGLDGDWMGRAMAYVEEMNQLDSDIATLLEMIPTENRKFVTAHDSLGYLADRYGLQVAGVILPGGSTLGEPSSADLARLVETMREQNIRAVFVEAFQPTALADSLVSELDTPVAVVLLYVGSIGDSSSGAGTLAEMLLVNATRISEALR